MPTVAQLAVEVGAKGIEDTQRKMGELSEHVNRAGGLFKTALTGALSFAGGLALFNTGAQAIGFVKDQLTGMVQAGFEANKSQAQTEAVIKSTGGVAGVTAQMVNDLATAMLNKAGIDDDATQVAENMLLTFTRISSDVFPATTQAVADMATKMAGGAIPTAQQLQQTAIQVGKALQDPIQGVTALQKVGVRLSDTQKEQVQHFMEVGDVASAQRVILHELNTEFGGSAEAAGKANGGIAILTAQFNNMKQTVGQALVPVLINMGHAIQPVLQALAGALPGAIQAVTPVFSFLWTVIQNVASVFLHNLQPGIEAIQRAFSSLGTQLGKLDLGQIEGAFTQVAGVIGELLSNAITTLLPKLQAFGSWLASNLGPALTSVGNFVSSVVVPALAQLGQFIVSTVLPAVQQLATWFVSHVLPVLQQVWQVIVTNVLPALQNLAQTVLTNLVPAIQNLWNKLAPILLPVLQVLGTVLQNVVGPALAQMVTAVSAVINIIAGVIGAISTVVKAISGFIAGIGPAWSGFWDGVRATLTNAWNAIKGVVQGAITFVVGLFKWLYDHNTYFKMLVDAIRMDFEFVRNVIMTIWNAISGFLSGVWNGIVNAARSMWNDFVFTVQSIGGRLLKAVKDTVQTGIITPVTSLGTTLFNAGKAIIQSLIDGVKNMAGGLGDAVHNVVQGALGALGFHGIPGFATGTFSAPGGLAMVGEQGPELVYLPRGSQVVPTGQTQAALAGRGGGSAGGSVTHEQTIIIQLDGYTLTKQMVKHLPNVVRIGTGINLW